MPTSCSSSDGSLTSKAVIATWPFALLMIYYVGLEEVSWNWNKIVIWEHLLSEAEKRKEKDCNIAKRRDSYSLKGAIYFTISSLRREGQHCVELHRKNMTERIFVRFWHLCHLLSRIYQRSLSVCEVVGCVLTEGTWRNFKRLFIAIETGLIFSSSSSDNFPWSLHYTTTSFTGKIKCPTPNYERSRRCL